MPRLLTEDELRSALSAKYSKSQSFHRIAREKRLHNINSFLSINREGLQYNLLERRIHLYSTLAGETIFLQMPGKESAKSNKAPMPKDFRPKLQCADDSMMLDASFAFIWDILENIGKQRNRDLSFIAAIIFRMAYMYEYLQTREHHQCQFVKIDDGEILDIRNADSIDLNWYQLTLTNDVWYSLNDRIGNIPITNNQNISFEAFIKYLDILLLNEDCKYYYRNVNIKGNPAYSLNNGRIPTCKANLAIIEFFKGQSRLSALLNKHGMPPFSSSKYSDVTDGIVT